MRIKKKNKSQNLSNLTNLDSLLSELQKTSNLTKEDLTKLLKEDITRLLKLFELQKELPSKKIEEIQIPVSIFKTDLAPLESLIKYLKENLNFSYKKISTLLNRSNKTIWSSYNIVIKKQPEKFIVKKSEFLIPISIFSNRKFSILESLILHLKSQQFSFKQVSALLQKDYRTIWTCYSRAQKKIKT